MDLVLQPQLSMAKSTSSFVVDTVVKWFLLCLLAFVLIYSKLVSLTGGYKGIKAISKFSGKSRILRQNTHKKKRNKKGFLI